MLSDCTAGSYDLNLWFDTDGIILTVTQCELMWKWMFLHLVCDSNFWAADTKESQPVAEQHCRTQVVYQVQIWESPSDTVILQKPDTHTHS